MRLSLAFALLLSTLFVSSNALADDCPPGSLYRSQDGFSFCEPTVCETDAQCNPGTEVCRPIGLCMQVGTLTSDAATLGDAGKRLVVTQRCAPDKTCPQTTVCSEKGRCISKAVADKMGLLTAAVPSTAASGPAAGEPAKKSCGCRAVGVHDDPTLLTLACAVLAVVMGGRRAGGRRRRS